MEEGAITSTRARDAPAQLARPFRVLVFDWDGTAVASRQEDASAVRTRLERLLRLGTIVVVVTGTNFGNVDRQLCDAMQGVWKQGLYVCANRGSEVYGFDADSHPILLSKRVASPSEERLLTEAAERTRRRMAQAGLDVRVIANRMNRRKIDLIPVAKWADPPKSAIGALLEAVQDRLGRSGWKGGLREVVELATVAASEVGLRDARITSDVKHVEIGLTDKGDAIDWAVRELGSQRGFQPSDMLVVGDEFGPIGGVSGSDAKMLTPGSIGASHASVGSEPGGVPEGVLHVGGGPPQFLRLLDAQIAMHRGGAPPMGELTPSRDEWLLQQGGLDLAREHEVESILALGNGHAGVRASLAEGTGFSASATFLAGVFDERARGDGMALAHLPDWTRIRVSIDGNWVRPDDGGLVEHRRYLDLRQGILFRTLRHRDSAGRMTRIEEMRLVSLFDRHELVQCITLVPENYGARLRFTAAIDCSGDVGLTSLSEPRGRAPEGVLVVEMRTRATGIVVAMGSLNRLELDGARVAAKQTSIADHDLAQEWELDAPISASIRFDRRVHVYSSRDVAHPAGVVRERLGRADHESTHEVIRRHTGAWEQRWQLGEVEVEGEESARKALRFAVYHLAAAANPDDELVSIGARALTGDAYRGHVFWDVEAFMLPFYIHSNPRAARALLMFRYNTLTEARAKARALGYRGALYPWEAAWQGKEATPSAVRGPGGEVIPIVNAEQEHHVNAAIAYGVWQYWHATGDDAFLLDAGAELLFETARFWASRCVRLPDGLLHLRGVMGPDEYHEGVDDNAYTNALASWNIARACDAWRFLQERFPDRCTASGGFEVSQADVDGWQEIARKMYRGFDRETNLFEQFQGYFDLEDIDLGALGPRTAPVDVLLGRERIRRSKIIKQADVLMLIHMLWDELPEEVRLANFRYYEARTAHGSSLSPPIHAVLAARLGQSALAEKYFQQTAEIDLSNNMSNAAGGVHAAALGGLWQAAVFGFGGMRARHDHVAFSPHLPNGWRSLLFRVAWRGSGLEVRMTRDAVEAKVVTKATGAVWIAIEGHRPVALAADHCYRATRTSEQWNDFEEARP
jgi:kojibiose phosphorylase